MSKHPSRNNNSTLVYSTETGRLCQKCGESHHTGPCQTTENESNLNGDGIVRIQRQTKGRKGKGVTLITGLALTSTELTTLAKQLKKQCGTGGTVKDGVVEIQGDYRELVLEKLKKLGFKAKISGG